MTTLRLIVPVAVFLSLLTGCETHAPKKQTALPPQANAPELSSPVAPPIKQAPKVQETAKPKPQADPAEALIAQVEKLYAAGQANYQAGHLEAAKASFDQAFNTLLSSNLEVRGDERLEREFDKLVDAVHDLEMAALKQGDGFSEPRSEPAPIDEANDVTFPVDPNIKAKAEAEIKVIKSDLPLVMNDYVASFINYFSSPRGRATLEHAWARSGRYHDMIARILKEEGVPQDLIYLAQAESGFQPLALSRAGARGIWQFMATSGVLYGLERNWWVDDRQDPEKATRAAARNLKDLYKQFGDWYLAMAAYNSGAGTVQHAVERTGYADFWELYHRNVLPKETQNYVPIILALDLISKDPARYGIDFDPEPALKADAVKPGQAIDLRLVAETIDTDLESLRGLNPELLRLVTPPDPEFVLHLPEGSAERFFSEIAAIPPEKWVSWRRHKVEQGETLSSLAKEYRVSPVEIADANELATGAALEEGQKLIIPAAARPETSTGKLIRYRVRRTDTIATIADEFDVSAAELRKWNHLRADHVVRGTSLRIYPGGMTDRKST